MEEVPSELHGGLKVLREMGGVAFWACGHRIWLFSGGVWRRQVGSSGPAASVVVRVPADLAPRRGCC